jgi:hypothetical protein
MKKIFLLLLLLPLSAWAQPPYNEGSYWAVTSVSTKPGRFDDYIEDLNSLWRRQMEKLKEDGKVKSYTMLSNVHARQGEPDLWLLVEWSSAGAMMDNPMEYWEKMGDSLDIDYDEIGKRAIKREDLRTIMSTSLVRELSFK